MKETGQNGLLNIDIAYKWKLDNPMYIYIPTEEFNNKVEYEQPDGELVNEVEKYTLFYSQSKALISIASKDDNLYQIMNNGFQSFEDKISNSSEGSIIIDKFGTKPE